MCMIDWPINRGEEEEEGRGMYCSRLGMPPVHINKMSFMLCILLTGHFQTSSTLELYICV